MTLFHPRRLRTRAPSVTPAPKIPVSFCSTCGSPVFPWRAHACPPAWMCICHGNERRLIYAETAAHAAERYAAWVDSDFGTLAAGRIAFPVTVTAVADGAERTYLIQPYTTPSYVAHPIE